MPTEKQRRQAAQRKLARQIERRREAERKRRQRYAIGGSAFVVAAIVILVLFLATDVFSGAHKKAAASPSPSASATPSASPTPTASPFATPTFKPAGGKPQKTSGACAYAETATSLKNPYVKDVGLPADPAVTPKTGTVDVSLQTTHGAMTFELNRADAPCAVQSFIYLVKKNFYNGTSCPRLVTTGIYVLQCGDPSNSQQGGPTYSYKQEATSKTSYGTGVIAMANTGQKNSTGSQFFIIYQDSNAGLKKNYSVIGKVTRGLSIVDNVAKAGSDNANQQGDGKPISGLTIKTATLAA